MSVTTISNPPVLTFLNTSTKHIKIRSCGEYSIFHKVNTHSSRKNIGSEEDLTQPNNATFGSLRENFSISCAEYNMTQQNTQIRRAETIMWQLPFIYCTPISKIASTAILHLT